MARRRRVTSRRLVAARRGATGSTARVAVARSGARSTTSAAPFTKFGQLIASSLTIFGDEVAAAFRGCLDDVRRSPFHEVKAAVEAELGRPVYELFAIDERPIAAASLAGRRIGPRLPMDAGGRKVLRPGIEHRIATDLAVLRPLCRFIARQVAVGIAGTLSGLVHGLENQLAEELDLRNEGARHALVPSSAR